MDFQAWRSIHNPFGLGNLPDALVSLTMGIVKMGATSPKFQI
ncbi:MAG: hypothetical protein RM022_005855 [Nostoc sp. EfeVER01]|nr:hypothetical protein [Nostoc sp. EfeVER01]MDZ7948564.1 hypothetical protein [Nostoc sp. EfeVER01]